eukprot:15355970-Alexandrium_andersonii.AAC.1
MCGGGVRARSVEARASPERSGPNWGQSEARAKRARRRPARSEPTGGQSEPRAERELLGAVSYTHLTLPTICGV